MDIEKAVAKYIEIRDKKAELVAQQKEALVKYNSALDKIEAALMGYFEETNSNSTKTSAGTAYTKRRVRAVVRDRESFIAWVIKTGKTEFLESKANVTAVQEFLAETEDCPPGVEVTTHRVVNINRSK